MAEICMIYGECEDAADDRVVFVANFAGAETICAISRSALDYLAKGEPDSILHIFDMYRERIAEVVRRRLAMNLGIMPNLSVE